MERIAALVEGQTEYHFVKKTYGNAIVQRPFPNGKDVSVGVIVECICDAIETLGGEISTVLVLLDREGRTDTSDEIRDQLLSSVSAKCTGRKLYVGVSDRHIENWILADEKFIGEKFGLDKYAYCGDGKKGKPILEQVSNKKLRAPSDKAELLKECSATAASQKSASLARLVKSIDFDWKWAMQ